MHIEKNIYYRYALSPKNVKITIYENYKQQKSIAKGFKYYYRYRDSCIGYISAQSLWCNSQFSLAYHKELFWNITKKPQARIVQK